MPATRRTFIKNTLKGAIVTSVGTSIVSEALASGNVTRGALRSGASTPFNQTPLPYSYSALENVIDTATMEIHYSKHAAAYSKNLIEAAAAENVSSMPLESILANISHYSTKMRNNGGGHYNHEMFWKYMRPMKTGNLPSGKLLNSINTSFGSFDNFKNQFSDAAKNRFGSGWAWLYLDGSKKLKIGSTANQDNPLMDVCEIKGNPILCLDVWEHAYYLKYQNKRADYINNWWNVVNWDYAETRYSII